MNWRAFERDSAYVLGKLREGSFDGLEHIARVIETEFFEYLLREGNFVDLAATYPTPRQREDVPLWVYLSAEISLRINASHGLKSLPYVLPCSGLRNVFGPEMVRRCQKAREDPRGVDVWEGFNGKNAYARTSPCDPDFVRKMARDTNPEVLQAWHNEAVARYYQSLGAYDSKGIFIADGTYLFVPDNPRYERSSRQVFDEHNHPVSKKEEAELPPEALKRLHWERFYRKVALLHTNWERDLYVYAGVRMLEHSESETPLLGPLVDAFIQAVGSGVMKILIHDRGFLDGAGATYLKQEHGIDTVFPLKARMQILDEAVRLAAYSDDPWAERKVEEGEEPSEPPAVRPEHIVRREQKRQETLRAKRERGEMERGEDAAPAKPRRVKTYAKIVRDLRIWDACKVPLQAAVMRDVYEDGKESSWVLVSTLNVTDPFELREYYRLRPTVEERFRQTKCFWDLTRFRSPNYSLVVNQVVFVLMAYSLVQIFLLKTGRRDLARKTRERLFQEFMLQEDEVVVYADRRVAFLSPLKHQETLLSLDEHGRRKLLGRTRELQAERSRPPTKPWRP